MTVNPRTGVLDECITELYYYENNNGLRIYIKTGQLNPDAIKAGQGSLKAYPVILVPSEQTAAQLKELQMTAKVLPDHQTRLRVTDENGVLSVLDLRTLKRCTIASERVKPVQVLKKMVIHSPPKR